MTTDTDAILASDPDFATICDARRDAAIEHMEASAATTGDARINALMAAAAAGDARAFDALYRATIARVRGYLMRLCGDAHAAEDLAQLVYLKVHRARASYRVGSDVVPWLFTIARNAFRDQRRSRRCRPEDLHAPETLNALQGTVEAPDATPWDVAPSRVADALRGLPATQREAVAALYLDGLTSQEAGERLGAEAGAVRVRACRGVAALRASLI